MTRPLRTTLFAFGGVLLVGLIGSGALAGLVLASTHDVDSQKDFAFSGDQLKITTDGGSIHLVPGVAGNLHVDRTITDSIRGGNPTWKLEGTTLALDTNCPSFMSITCDGDYTVSVPLGIPITVRGDNGSITADGMRQQLDLRSNNGSIKVRDSSGNLKLTSNNGSISVDRTVADRLDFSTDNGSLRATLLNAPTYVKGSSDNGSAKLYLPRGPEAYNVQLSASNGSDKNNVRQDPMSPRLIDISSDNGSVKVDYASTATPTPVPTSAPAP
ncbi:MAG: DUF4097 family beta strand repeat protein [Streptomycetaceae bacterium]|nr:DUF4097 family beta strand repeat protein [Streptomycetaceae bacterium]